MSLPPVGAELFVLALTEEWSHEAERKCWIFPRSPGQCHSVLHQSHRVLVRTDLTFFTFILIRDNFASATLIWGQMIPNSKKTNPVTHFLLYFPPITADFCAFTALEVLLGFKMTKSKGSKPARKWIIWGEQPGAATVGVFPRNALPGVANIYQLWCKRNEHQRFWQLLGFFSFCKPCWISSLKVFPERLWRISWEKEIKWGFLGHFSPPTGVSAGLACSPRVPWSWKCWFYSSWCL